MQFSCIYTERAIVSKPFIIANEFHKVKAVITTLPLLSNLYIKAGLNLIYYTIIYWNKPLTHQGQVVDGHTHFADFCKHTVSTIWQLNEEYTTLCAKTRNASCSTRK